jgi:AcrR family transcriptional regulator
VLLWTLGPKEHRARSRGAGWLSDENEARERSLAAADACYAEKGPMRTRMSDIARRAGVRRPTVYYYFAQKDTLLAAAFVRVLAATSACLRGTDIARSSRSTSASSLSLRGPRRRRRGLAAQLASPRWTPCAQHDRRADTTDD